MGKIVTFEFVPSGVCAKKIDVNVDVENKTVEGVSFNGGCNGNHQGISRLICGQNIDEVATKLEGVRCGGRGTSCPDQLSCALKKISEVINKENNV